MRQMLEYKSSNYNVLEIDDDVTILEYLRQKNLRRSFNLRYISEECFELLRKNDRSIYVSRHNYVAGYSYPVSNSFRNSGGLKLSDEKSQIFGSFTIEDDRVIYSPIMRFYEEENASDYLYENTFFTTLTMQDLLLEELKKERKFLIDMGQRLKGFNVVQEYEEITSDEMMEFATDIEKGRGAFKKMMNRFYE